MGLNGHLSLPSSLLPLQPSVTGLSSRQDSSIFSVLDLLDDSEVELLGVGLVMSMLESLSLLLRLRND